MKDKPIGATMSWSGTPCLCFEGGYILFGNAERILYPEYFTNGDWPTNPDTGENLPIYKV
jgi:hypothetical protein